MPTNFQQTNTNANASAIAVLCSANSNNTDRESNTATRGGAAGSTERIVTVDGNAADLNAVWMEITGIDNYKGTAGTWVTRLNITTSNHQITLDEIHICRVNSSYVNQQSLGSLTGIGANLGSTGVQTHNVTQGSATTILPGDKIIVIYAFDNGNSMTQDIGYTPNQITQGPAITVTTFVPSVVGATATANTVDLLAQRAFNSVITGQTTTSELILMTDWTDDLIITWDAPSAGGKAPPPRLRPLRIWSRSIL